MKTRWPLQYVGLLSLISSTAWAASNVSFSQPAETVEAYEFVEVIARVDKPDGEKIPLPPVKGPVWTSPKTPGWLDWALLIKKQPPQ